MSSDPELEKCTKSCLNGTVVFVIAFIFTVLVILEYNIVAAIFGVLAVPIFIMIWLATTKMSKNNEEWQNESGPTPLHTISSAVHTAPSHQPAVRHSPYIAPQTMSPRPRPLTLSALATLDVSSFEVAQQGAVEVSAGQVTNQQPPTYPDILENYYVLPLQPFTTPAAEEGSRRVVGPSSDGLPSYEAAVSMRQLDCDAATLYTPS